MKKKIRAFLFICFCVLMSGMSSMLTGYAGTASTTLRRVPDPNLIMISENSLRRASNTVYVMDVEFGYIYLEGRYGITYTPLTAEDLHLTYYDGTPVKNSDFPLSKDVKAIK